MSALGFANSFEVYADSERPEMLQFLPPFARKILDVGCSVGNFGALVKTDRPAEVWGVEVDPEAAREASSKLDKVLCGHFSSELEIPSGMFDCIVFNDVLEHMIDPSSALRYANELLGTNGRIVASVPNVRYFQNVWKFLVDKNWEYEDSGILDRTHLRFFTKRSIRSLFAASGLTIERLEGINAVDYNHAEFRNWFRVLNKALLNSIEDMRWMQFAVVAKIDG